MIRLDIIDQDGKVLLPKDVATAAELLTLVEQARGVIRDCERLAQQKGPMKGRASGTGRIPYLN
jgi:hypothetical protein